MTRWSILWTAAVAVLAAAASGTVWAGEPEEKGDKVRGELPQEKQEQLLERFGDQGIDADGDGTLTHEEVRAFLKERRGDGEHGKRGRHGPGGPKRGRRGPATVDNLLEPAGYRRRRSDHDRHRRTCRHYQPADMDSRRMRRMDQDGDGEVSQEEWTASAEKARQRTLKRLAEIAPEADANGDGTISDEELAAFRTAHDAKQRERILKEHPEADTDGDGVLSDEELAAFKEARAAERRAKILEKHPEADTDGDGVLSEEEARAFMRDRRGPGGPRGHWGEPGEGRGHGAGRGHGPI